MLSLDRIKEIAEYTSAGHLGDMRPEVRATIILSACKDVNLEAGEKLLDEADFDTLCRTIWHHLYGDLQERIERAIHEIKSSPPHYGNGPGVDLLESLLDEIKTAKTPNP